MKTQTLRQLLALFLAAGFSAAAAGQTSGADDRPNIVATRVGDLTVDGHLDEALYLEIEPETTFVQQEPLEGESATERTEVWVLYDEDNLYVSARMWDSHPERMIANEMRRDAAQDMYQNENFSIVLDTFNDQRSGYYFMTNMLGGMRDVHFVSESQANGEWNPIWNPRAQQFDQGWTVEVEIPFKSIRYPSSGEQVWGIQFRRVVRWKNEVTYLTRIPASVGAGGIFRMQDAGVLTGLRTPAGGIDLEVKPYAISNVTTRRTASPPVSNDLDADVGIDVKVGVTQALTADFTYNTDFAQVEDDLQQVNLTRFGLFFPEKREFFLEGQGIFDFGGQEGNIPTMFFSRRIGLEQRQSVPIHGGARLTGKIGKYSLGLLDIQTAESTDVGSPTTNYGAARLRRDILGKSYVGLLMTQRTPSGADNNTLVGVDSLLAFGVTQVNLYYAKTQTSGRNGDDGSYLASFDYNADRYGLRASHLTVQPDFNPEVGFLRRRNFRSNQANFRFSPRPTDWPSIRKLFYQGGIEYITNNDGRLESRAATAGFRVEFESGAGAGATYERDFERLDLPFEIAPSVTIPIGGYSFDRVGGSYSIGPTHRIRGTIGVTTGSFYTGTRHEARYSGRVEVSKQLIVEPTVSLNWVDLPWGDFRTRLLSARTTYTLTPRSVLGALIQYNSSNDSLSTNVRFRWEYIPGSDLFVVYSEGRDTAFAPDRFAVLEDRKFVVKITRMFRY